MEMEKTNLKCDVVITHADLELLLPHNVFLWPISVIFPKEEKKKA